MLNGQNNITGIFSSTKNIRFLKGNSLSVNVLLLLGITAFILIGADLESDLAVQKDEIAQVVSILSDSEDTVGLSPELTAATGMDALSHGMEAVSSAQREPIADALGLHAIRLVREHLPAVVKNGGDIAARGQMLIAATLGGAAFSNAQVGLMHAISHVVGARHGVHHGLANAIAMPYVIRFNNDVVADRHRLIAEAFGLDVRGLSDEAAGLALALAVIDFNKQLGLPRSFREAGVPEADLGACADAAMYDGSIVYNSKPVSEPTEVLSVLKAAWAGAA